MPTNVTVNASVQWTPPSAPANSGNATFNVVAPCNAQNVGQIDVQTTDAPNTSFAIPFGSVAAAKILIIKNMLSAEIAVRLNGSGSDNFRIAAGGVLMYSAPIAPGSTPLSSVTVLTTASPSVIENVQFFVYGD